MVAAMAPIGLGALAPALELTTRDPLELLHDYIAQSEAGFEMVLPMFSAELAPIAGVTRSVEVIRGLDGNDITLFIHRPEHTHGPVPAVLHLHGGGMVMLEAAGSGYARWRDLLAAAGMVVVGVEFRNGSGKLGPNPFPAGLNDCSSALQWLGANKAKLGVSKIVVSGESGGGNLTLATTLKAKRDGHLGLIDGVYAQCPYISGAYLSRTAELASLVENEGYFLATDQMGLLAHIYDPAGENATNPLAWPYHVTLSELAGLPPHVISVNELDPLRDEGLAYFRRLVGAGVSAVGRTVNGTCHAGDCIFEAAMPEVTAATIRDIAGFANSL